MVQLLCSLPLVFQSIRSVPTLRAQKLESIKFIPQTDSIDHQESCVGHILDCSNVSRISVDRWACIQKVI